MFRELRNEPWAVRPEVLAEIADIVYGRITGPEVAARVAQADTADPGEVSGELAIIPLRGLITPRGSLLSLLFGFGGGGLQGFRASFREAVASADVGAVLIDIDSPGGLVDLVPETAAEIREARGSKPIVAISNTDACSAAYWIGAQADELVLTPSGAVGSVGVFTLHEDISKLEKDLGVKTTLVSAGRYKTEGNPYEPLSAEAKKQMQREVDEIYGLFVADVAAGRGVPEATVESGYGEGRIALASQALQEGMVDRIDTFEATAARLGAAAVDEPDGDTPPVEDDDEGEPRTDDEAEETSPPRGGGDEEERARIAELLLP